MLLVVVLVLVIPLASSDGNLCYECNGISHPSDCTIITQCGQHERCYAEQVATSSGIVLYNTGCMATDICRLSGKKRSSLCSACCSSDYCNKGQCSNHNVTEYGTRCLQCKSVADPTTCNTVTLCDVDSMCYIEQKVVFGRLRHELGCRHKSVCNANPVFGRSLSKRDQQYCHACCDKENCNRAICVSVGNLKPPEEIRDCQDLMNKGATSNGVYSIYPTGSPGYQVYCDMSTPPGGWTVFQRRFDGSQNFSLNFASYTHGFGSVYAEYWLGNQRLHELTSSASYMLRIDLTNLNHTSRHSQYSHFSVGDASTQFTLSVSGYSGNMGDIMSYQNGGKFYTYDKDINNCAKTHKSGWWYNLCHLFNLNGVYLHRHTSTDGIWNHKAGFYNLLETTEMKIRNI